MVWDKLSCNLFYLLEHIFGLIIVFIFLPPRHVCLTCLLISSYLQTASSLFKPLILICSFLFIKSQVSSVSHVFFFYRVYKDFSLSVQEHSLCCPRQFEGLSSVSPVLQHQPVAVLLSDCIFCANLGTVYY